MKIEQRYEHEGFLDWECPTCRSSGAKEFHFQSCTDPPKVSDYEPVLTEIEIEHSLTGCKGSPVMMLAARQRVIERLPKGRSGS